MRMALTAKDVLERYSVRDYRIRYRAAGAVPDTGRAAQARFVVECAPGDLVADPLGQPLLFETEAEAFAYRRRLGIPFPVLVFYEAGHEPECEEYDEVCHGPLADEACIDAYVDGES
ncbi:MAG: hypothetical protein ACYDBH_04495 [Acidobacteriaceae bacterium]